MKPQSKFAPLNDAEWLSGAVKVHTTRNIAEIVGCSQCAVQTALTRHCIPAGRPPGRPSVPDILKDCEWLKAKYEHLTSREIAKEVGCSNISVIKALKVFGIPMIPTRRIRKGKYQQRAHPTKKNRQEHRMIMETLLGRDLLPNEHVHHIDGDGRNNDISNLVVLFKNDHHKLHAPDFTARMKAFGSRSYNRICISCDKQFKAGNRAKRCDDCKR